MGEALWVISYLSTLRATVTSEQSRTLLGSCSQYPTVPPEFHIYNDVFYTYIQMIHVLVGDRLFNWYKHHSMGLMTVK